MHFLLHDHFINSPNLISWQCMDIIRRKLMLVTIGTLRVTCKQTLQFIGWRVLPLLYHANGVGNKASLCTGRLVLQCYIGPYCRWFLVVGTNSTVLCSTKAISFFSGVQNWHLPSQNFFGTLIFPLTSKGGRGQECQFCKLLFVCFCSLASHTPLYFHCCKCTLVKCLSKFIFTITQLLIFTWSRAMFDESIGHGNDGIMAQLAFLFSLHVVFCESVQWNHYLAACGSTSLWLEFWTFWCHFYGR